MSLESTNRLSELTGMDVRTIKRRLATLQPTVQGRAHTYESRDALPLLYGAQDSAAFDLNQERVARSLGASRATAFVTVTLPQLRFSVVSAALLSFLTSFDEVILALFIAGGGNSTLTRNMFTALRDQVDTTIAAISTLMILVTTAGLIAAERWGRPKPR